jgi:hypothetical protein
MLNLAFNNDYHHIHHIFLYAIPKVPKKSGKRIADRAKMKLSFALKFRIALSN